MIIHGIFVGSIFKMFVVCKRLVIFSVEVWREWPLSCAPLRIIKARSHCYNGWRVGERACALLQLSRCQRSNHISPARIVNTARCLARIKSAAGHSPIMHLCILCITRMGHYAYKRDFARTDADVRSLFRRCWKKWGAITFYCYWLWWMRPRITFARTHSAGGGGWRLLLFASGSAADATDAAPLRM